MYYYINVYMHALMVKIGNDWGKMGTCSVQQMEQHFFIIKKICHTTKTVYAKGVASLTDTVASPVMLNI